MVDIINGWDQLPSYLKSWLLISIVLAIGVLGLFSFYIFKQPDLIAMTATIKSLAIPFTIFVVIGGINIFFFMKKMVKINKEFECYDCEIDGVQKGPKSNEQNGVMPPPSR